MYDPPPGYADLEADASTAPAQSGPFHELVVDGVGPIHARTPMPNAAAALAMSSNSKISDRARIDYLGLFVQNHVRPGEYEELLGRMITDDTCPPDAMVRVSRAIATAGTARPI